MKRLVLVASAVALALTAAPAYAHVAVQPKEAPSGGTETFTFTVPNEEAPARTVRIELFFPEGTAFTTVEVTDVGGWQATKTPSSLVWNGGTISGGDEMTFPVRLGPMPADRPQLVFKVLQTYDNGEVVRWIDVATGTEEPPHPAPIVRLLGAEPATTTTTVTTTTATARDSDDGSAAPLLLLAALFVAGIGGGIALFSVVSRRRSA